MAMSAAQVSAFESGSGITAASLSTFVMLFAGALILLWFAWEIYGLYKAWAERGLDLYDAAWALTRAGMWTMLVTWVIHP